MCAPAFCSLVKNRIMLFNTGLDIVCVEYGVFGRISNAVCSKHFNISIADEQDTGASPGSSADGMCCFFSSCRNNRMRGKKRSQVLGYTDRSHTRTTASMRNGKSFMQIKMTYVCADVSRICKSDLGIHISSIHVNLSAAIVDDFSYL